jgi:hypothetical protein
VTAFASAEVNVPTGITPTGTKQVSITVNGTTTEDVTAYANAQITVNVVNQDYEDALTAFGVTEDLADGIEALTSYANGVTGESDTTLSDAVASLTDGYGQGGGISQGIEIVTDSNGKITDYILHMETVPDFALNNLGYNRNDKTVGVPNVTFAVKPKHIGTYAFYQAHVKIDWSGLSEVETINGNYSLTAAFNQYNDAYAGVVNLPKFVGPTATDTATSLFRSSSAYAPKVFKLPVCTIIPPYAWNSYASTGLDVTIGSIGHAVTESRALPFGSTSKASGTVMIYTTGDVLDTLRSAVQQNAGANISFIYKAAEATTYNGTSYQAGDTITV